jgi:hypothetical protein
MRILGAILIVVGFLFCLSIVGAVIGIPLMIIGLIFVVVGGRRKTIITNVVTVSNAPHARPDDNRTHQPRAPDLVGRDTQPRLPPIIDVSPRLQDGYSRQPVEARLGYDRNKWDALVKYDKDIADVALKLEALGPPWVDEFAKAYLAINDKSYLPVIVQKIINDAREAQGRTT